MNLKGIKMRCTGKLKRDKTEEPNIKPRTIADVKDFITIPAFSTIVNPIRKTSTEAIRCKSIPKGIELTWTIR